MNFVHPYNSVLDTEQRKEILLINPSLEEHLGLIGRAFKNNKKIQGNIILLKHD